jgi:hypothetical protein
MVRTVNPELKHGRSTHHHCIDHRIPVLTGSKTEMTTKEQTEYQRIKQMSTEEWLMEYERALGELDGKG